jgi:hypothetical protein
MRSFQIAIAITLLLPGAARLSAQDTTAVKQGQATTFSFQQKVTVPVEPALAYDLATGDISGWWDHKFSEQPAQFCIDARAGGGFWELFDTEGQGLRHAVVTWAQRGKRLRFEGPLGLAGSAVQSVMTYDFAPAAGGTELTLTVNVAGQVEPSWPAGVSQVWQHFLGRYRDYVVAFKAAGKPDARPKQCGPGTR